MASVGSMIVGIGRFSVAIFHGALNITASIVSDEPMIGMICCRRQPKSTAPGLRDDVTLVFFAAKVACWCFSLMFPAGSDETFAVALYLAAPEPPSCSQQSTA
jgi:hypothetical protein